MTLAELIDLALKNRVQRLRAQAQDVGTFEFEFHPSAFAPAPNAEAPDVDEDRCNCEHSLSVEHNEQGCLKGCDFAICQKPREGGK